MAVTVTLDAKTNQHRGAVGVWLARGKKIQVGTLNFSTSATFTASSNIALGLKNIDSVKINNASGYSFEYHYTNAGVMGFAPGGATTVAASVIGMTEVRFMAIGE